MTEAEEKEKAEKLAAAKKRYEQLKKQKGKKAGAKKKDDKIEAEIEPHAHTEKTEEVPEGATTLPQNDTAEAEASEEAQAAEDGAQPTESERPPHARQPSLSLQSRMRSESFRRASTAQSPLSPTSATLKSPTLPPLSLGGDAVQDIYRKQAQRIEELERENKRLAVESDEAETRRRKAEDELEELREANAEVAELKSKAAQADTKSEELEKLRTEVVSLQRQNAQLQTQAKRRSVSTSSPSNANADDLASQLASKSNTIESLELEISNLHTQLSQATTTNSEQAGQIIALQTSLARAERAAESAAQELSDLKHNLERASERAVKEGSSRTSAETRIAQLETDLATAQRAADDAGRRAETLEKKIETLTTLHREADARNQARAREADKTEREAKELRARVAALSNETARLKEAGERRRRADVQGTDDGVDELEDEERQRLANRVRELEEEVFELRRGVWRDRRREMQPGLEDPSSGAEFDDVDLSGAASPRRAAASSPYRGSTFQDVIASGINAFTGGGGRRGSVAAKQQQPRKQSLGLLSEDEDEMAFDEEAFRAAQEEEARKRIERVREVKRGLKRWEGWRVDIVDVRAGMGGVFDI